MNMFIFYIESFATMSQFKLYEYNMVTLLFIPNCSTRSTTINGKALRFVRRGEGAATNMLTP
jgi:hypothetical protein